MDKKEVKAAEVVVEAFIASSPTPLLRRLAMFQREDIQILKSKQAHGYMYAPLDNICEAIAPYMEKYGIGYIHTITFDKEDKKHYLKTILFNEFDTKDTMECITRIDEDVELVKQNKFMVMGSAITYFRRYHLVTLLGLTTDEDTDAGGAKPGQEKVGRSVEAAGLKEGETNYISIFANLINKKKTEVQVRQSFEIHKKNMTPEVAVEVEALIVRTFNKGIDGSK